MAPQCFPRRWRRIPSPLRTEPQACGPSCGACRAPAEPAQPPVAPRRLPAHTRGGGRRARSSRPGGSRSANRPRSGYPAPHRCAASRACADRARAAWRAGWRPPPRPPARSPSTLWQRSPHPTPPATPAKARVARRRRAMSPKPNRAWTPDRRLRTGVATPPRARPRAAPGAAETDGRRRAGGASGARFQPTPGTGHRPRRAPIRRAGHTPPLPPCAHPAPRDAMFPSPSVPSLTQDILSTPQRGNTTRTSRVCR